MVVFGPLKAMGMARELGRFVSRAKRTVEEFKSELLSEEVEEVGRTVEELKDEVQHSAEELETDSRPSTRSGTLRVP